MGRPNKRLIDLDAQRDKIRTAMKKEKMSMNTLAECLGIPVPRVVEWFKYDDAMNIPIEMYYLLSKVLNVPLDYWVEDDMADEVTVALMTKRNIFNRKDER